MTSSRAPFPARQTGQPDRYRTFIAVPLAADVRDAAASARAHLAAFSDRLRWVSPEHLHLTLQFLGDITPAGVVGAAEAAGAAAGADAPFAITFAGLGAFPSAAAARVVWVGVARGADRLTALAKSLARALRDRGFSLDARPFAPHLTLARVRGTGRPPDVRGQTRALDQVMLGDQSVRELIVVTSVLGQAGPTHTIVATVPLGGASRKSEGM